MGHVGIDLSVGRPPMLMAGVLLGGEGQVVTRYCLGTACLSLVLLPCALLPATMTGTVLLLCAFLPWCSDFKASQL